MAPVPILAPVKVEAAFRSRLKQLDVSSKDSFGLVVAGNKTHPPMRGVQPMLGNTPINIVAGKAVLPSPVLPNQSPISKLSTERVMFGHATEQQYSGANGRQKMPCS